VASSLNAALIMTLLLAPLWSTVFYFLTDTFYPYLNSDPEVIKLGSEYLQIRIVGITFVTANFCFRGFWNATDQSKVYMRTLILMHITNIFLNYVFIFGNFGAPKLGVYGAGLATTISVVLGSFIYTWMAFQRSRPEGFLRKLPSKGELKNQLSVTLNVGITQTFFAAGLTALYWVIGKIGTAELAAANVLINVTLVAILPAIGFGISSATLVGQALGRKDPADANQWGWDVVKVGSMVVLAIALPMLLVPGLIIPIFIDDPNTVALASMPMRLSGAFLIIDAAGMILMNAMQGAGYAKPPMFASIFLQWFLYLPLCFLVGPVLGFGLLGVWICHVCYRSLQTLVMVILWNRGHWKHAKA